MKLKLLLLTASISLFASSVFCIPNVASKPQQVDEISIVEEQNSIQKLYLEDSTSDEETKENDKKKLLLILLVIPVVGIAAGLTFQFIKIKKSKK